MAEESLHSFASWFNAPEGDSNIEFDRTTTFFAFALTSKARQATEVKKISSNCETDSTRSQGKHSSDVLMEVATWWLRGARLFHPSASNRLAFMPRV